MNDNIVWNAVRRALSKGALDYDELTAFVQRDIIVSQRDLSKMLRNWTEEGKLIGKGTKLTLA